MDPHKTVQEQIEQLVRKAPRAVPRHQLADKLRQAGYPAAPAVIQGALARLLARGRLSETSQGLVATPLRTPLLITA